MNFHTDDEEMLKGLLQEAASAFPPPEGLREELKSAVFEMARRTDVNTDADTESESQEERRIAMRGRYIRRFAVAAAIVAAVACGTLVAKSFLSEGKAGENLAALSLVRKAYAAEEDLFKQPGILSIVNEIIVTPVSDSVLAESRWIPIVTLDAAGKLHFDQLTLSAEGGKEYVVQDRIWYDSRTGCYVRVLEADGKPVYAASYDGRSVRYPEIDASGTLRLAAEPAARDFRPPTSPAQFLGIAAGLGHSLQGEDKNLYTDAGETVLQDGSKARVVVLQDPEGNPEGQPRPSWRFSIRESDDTIAEMAFQRNGDADLRIRRVQTDVVETPGIPWDLAGIEILSGKAGEHSDVSVSPDMVIPNVEIAGMIEKADFETYVPASAPAWAGDRQIMDILDVASPPHRMFSVTYRGKDGRHVVFVQSYTYNKMLGPMTKLPGAKLVYTSPTGVKVWSGPRDQWLAEILLKSAQSTIKDKPSPDRTGYLLETPAGTYPAIAVNGKMSEAELHSLIDSLIPAKDYQGK